MEDMPLQEDSRVGASPHQDSKSIALTDDGGSGNVETNWVRRDFDELIKEATALAMYVARHGDSLSGKEAKDLYRKLITAVADAKSVRSVANWKSLMGTYQEVTAVTYKERGVNGRTLLDTQAKLPVALKWLSVPRIRPTVIGVGLFALAMTFQVLEDWSGNVSDPGTLTGVRALGYALISALYEFVAPAIWGGIGACVFLMKRLSDKLFEMAYEESRLRGDVTRIVLGAMLGVVVVVLFFPDFGEQIQFGEAGLAPVTAAFVAGLGVKPVYAGFESLSEELARRFTGKKESNTK